MPQIEVENLTRTFRVSERASGLLGALAGLFRRRYRVVTALDSVSFSIERGELVGYIGPNGAGKSTTVKILSGILVPDSGICTVDGRIPWKKRTAHVRHIGVVFGQRSQLWWDLPVQESFDLLRDIYNIEKSVYEETRREMIELLALDSFLDTPVRQLSLGQRMRCEIAASLLHQPDILFLDEPTIGLDAVAKLAVRDFIKKINRLRNVTVILTTHDMDDIEAICKRVLVIGKGQILYDGHLDDLRNLVENERYLTIDLENERENFSCDTTELIDREGGRIHLRFNPTQILPAKLIADITSRYEVKDIFVENPPIERVIARFYADRENGPPKTIR
jgi:ABC-2 type transport system ATP-binding protein